MKTVLYVLPAAAVGGAETKFFTVIKQMKGVRSLLLTNSRAAGHFAPLGIRMHLFEDYGCGEPMPFSLRNAFSYARAVAKVVRLEPPDCIVGVMHTGLFYLSAARDLYRIAVPCVGTIEGNITAYFRSEHRSPTLLERMLLRYLLGRLPRIIVPSRGVGRDLAENYGVSEDRISHVYNGIDIEHVRALAEERISPVGRPGKMVVTACRMDHQKDFGTLLEAFRKVREEIEATLVIVGDGPLRAEIGSRAESLGIGESLVMTGFRDNPFPFIRDADVFVLSSLFEGFGNVLVEAMALGVPVVSTDCPSGPAEVIEQGISGILVPVGTADGMAAALLRVLRHDDLSNVLREQGMRRAERFRMEEMVEAFRGELAAVWNRRSGVRETS